MVSIKQLQQQELMSDQNSLLHSVDTRIKLIVLLIVILYTVTSTDKLVFITMEVYLIILIIISKIGLKDALMRVLLILPFGFFIAIFQPFIQPGQVLYTLPLGLNITLEGIEFAALLLSRLVVTITATILFSFITPMKDLAVAFRQLHMPHEFAMIFTLFVRFIFLFYDELQNIRNAQASRGFTFTNKTPYLWKVRQVGYLFLMMFIRSYEKGEIVYSAMASRGYSSHSRIYTHKTRLTTNSILYILIPVIIMIILTLITHNII